MQFVSVETLGGDMIPVNIYQITHMTQTGLGTRIYFTSGEAIDAAKSLGELTLDLMPTQA